MTALDKYVRLEAIGHWQPRANAETQEIIVSFGNSTLQFTSMDDTPLTHWALRAVKRVGTKGSSIIYSPDNQADETLLIDDPDMIRAITAVTFEIGQMQPRKRSLKKYVWLGVLILAIGLLSQSGPIIYSWAAKLTSPARLEMFAKDIDNQMQQQSPRVCLDYRAVAALSNFSTLLELAPPPELIVSHQKSPTSYGLANGDIHLAYDLISQSSDAETLAAEIVVAYMMIERRAQLLHVLEKSGPFASIGHIFGRDVQPNLPMNFPTPLATDYVTARDHLYAIGISTGPLQEMASRNGFGLPVKGSADITPFAPQIFKNIKTYCAS